MNPVRKALEAIRNQYVYNPETKRAFPNSPLYTMAQMSKLDPHSPEYRTSSIDLAGKLLVGGLAETPAKRALLDATGRKVIDNSGMIDALASQVDEGALRVQPGKQINLNLVDQADDVYRNVFKKNAGNISIQQVIAKLKEAADGYRTEQVMKARPSLLHKF